MQIIAVYKLYLQKIFKNHLIIILIVPKQKVGNIIGFVFEIVFFFSLELELFYKTSFIFSPFYLFIYLFLLQNLCLLIRNVCVQIKVQSGQYILC